MYGHPFNCLWTRYHQTGRYLGVALFVKWLSEILSSQSNLEFAQEPEGFLGLRYEFFSETSA